MRILNIILSAVFFILSASLSRAAIQLPSIIGDNMVLQQNSDVLLWGKAAPDTKVTVSVEWSREKFETSTDSEGKWKVKVRTVGAGGPYMITIKAGKDLREISNVLLGEVWLCGGQSNMDLSFRGLQNQPVANACEEILDSDYPELRLFRVKREYSATPKDDCQGRWNVSNTLSAETFSALGYLFGRQLHKSEKVPVGLIACAWGGSKVEAWMSYENIMQFKGVRIPEKIDRYRANLTPTLLYNAMINPIAGFKIRGCIFYQGEANINNADDYLQRFPAMVKEWREKWDDDFPFFYVQIAPYSYPKYRERSAAYFREIQHKCQRLIPNSEIIATTDVGASYTIHPMDKQTVAKRLHAAVSAKCYGHKGFQSNGPVFRKMDFHSDTIALVFNNAPYGLSSHGEPIAEFEVAGHNKVFYPAEAWLKGRSTVWLHSQQVKDPVAVRYCYKNYSKGNLYNNYGFAAFPFRTDSWNIKEPVKIIFETDMGNDVDDAIALDMLYKFKDAGLADILMISCNKADEYSVPYIGMLNHIYGYGNIPVSTSGFASLPLEISSRSSYAENIVKSGLFPVPETVAYDSVDKYRQILAEQPDNSVVIVSVGFLSNLKALLESGPDKHSQLTGKELVAAKVRFLSMMGGSFDSSGRKEFNIRFDVGSARSVFETWPTDILLSPWETGAKVIFKSGFLKGFSFTGNHPVKMSYEDYLPMPYNRECWDQTSLIAAVVGVSDWFRCSERGVVEVDDAGRTGFRANENGNVIILNVDNALAEKHASYIRELVSEMPKRWKGTK